MPVWCLGPWFLGMMPLMALSCGACMKAPWQSNKIFPSMLATVSMSCSFCCLLWEILSSTPQRWVPVKLMFYPWKAFFPWFWHEVIQAVSSSLKKWLTWRYCFEEKVLLNDFALHRLQEGWHLWVKAFEEKYIIVKKNCCNYLSDNFSNILPMY